MRGSTSRLKLGALVRPRCSPNVSYRRPGRSLPGAVAPVVSVGMARMSSQPKQIGGKGKRTERYNYNTSMSFSDEVDPDVGARERSPLGIADITAYQLPASHRHGFGQSQGTANKGQDVGPRLHR